MTTSRHVLIYGPPAAGKLTVARSLAQTYNLKLLDNHLTADLALRLFARDAKPFMDLVVDLRVVLSRAAAAGGLDVVSTMVFVDPTDRPWLDRVVVTAQAEGATFSYVQLRPPPSVLEERVTTPDRKTSQKLRDVEGLRRALERMECYEKINEGDLAIDNSNMTPEEVAGQIAKHIGLSPLPDT